MSEPPTQDARKTPIRTSHLTHKSPGLQTLSSPFKEPFLPLNRQTPRRNTNINIPKRSPLCDKEKNVDAICESLRKQVIRKSDIESPERSTKRLKNGEAVMKTDTEYAESIDSQETCMEGGIDEENKVLENNLNEQMQEKIEIDLTELSESEAPSQNDHTCQVQQHKVPDKGSDQCGPEIQTGMSTEDTRDMIDDEHQEKFDSCDVGKDDESSSDSSEEPIKDEASPSLLPTTQPKPQVNSSHTGTLQLWKV